MLCKPSKIIEYHLLTTAMWESSPKEKTQKMLLEKKCFGFSPDFLKTPELAIVF